MLLRYTSPFKWEFCSNIHNDAGRTEDSTAYCTTTVKLDNGAPCLWIIHGSGFLVGLDLYEQWSSQQAGRPSIKDVMAATYYHEQQSPTTMVVSTLTGHLFDKAYEATGRKLFRFHKKSVEEYEAVQR